LLFAHNILHFLPHARFFSQVNNVINNQVVKNSGSVHI